VLAFWVFHVIRDYAATLEGRGGRYRDKLPGWLSAAERLERVAQPIELVFGHNDLLAANFIDDGHRLWLIDWDYAGFNSPLFDLGGLAGNNGLGADQEAWLLDAYFERPIEDELRWRYEAMKCAALLREGMWGLVSELCSALDHDFAAYAATSLTSFERAFRAFADRWGPP
jgi:thiamine kinase-like enzyme